MKLVFFLKLVELTLLELKRFRLLVMRSSIQPVKTVVYYLLWHWRSLVKLRNNWWCHSNVWAYLSLGLRFKIYRTPVYQTFSHGFIEVDIKEAGDIPTKMQSWIVENIGSSIFRGWLAFILSTLLLICLIWVPLVSYSFKYQFRIKKNKKN